MKKSTLNSIKSTVSILLCAGVCAILGACASASKSGDPAMGADGLPLISDNVSGNDVLNPIDNDPARKKGEDPATAYDWEVLAPYTVYFGYDSFSIDASERSKLQAIASYIKSHPGKHIMVAGHCDARGTTEYNLALGERRANAVRDYLIGLGADRSTVSTISYGEEKPAVQGTDEAAYAKNRRAQTGVYKN